MPIEEKRRQKMPIEEKKRIYASVTLLSKPFLDTIADKMSAWNAGNQEEVLDFIRDNLQEIMQRFADLNSASEKTQEFAACYENVMSPFSYEKKTGDDHVIDSYGGLSEDEYFQIDLTEEQCYGHPFSYCTALLQFLQDNLCEFSHVCSYLWNRKKNPFHP